MERREGFIGRWPLWAVVVAAWTVVALLLSGSMYFAALAVGEPRPAGRALGIGFLESYVWIPVTLAAFALTRRFPLEPGHRVRNGLVHLGAGLLLVVVKMAPFHYIGQALGFLTRETPFRWAVIAYTGQTLVTYTLLVGVAHAVEYARRIRERELARAQLETQLMQAQLQMLKVQLHPHFLFNTLNAISSLVHRSPDAAERMIASLSDLLRTTLAHGQEQEVTLREEMDLLEPYLDIERTRFGERLAVETKVEPETLHAQVPHLLLQPLIENAIRHGIAPRRGPGRVEVASFREDGRLHLRVTDDGRGLPENGTSGGNGVGLSNTRARLQRLYGEEHRFRIANRRRGGVTVEIVIPFREGRR